MSRFICIHGHFYQPPRENPWLEEVEYEDSAHPFHDWNERVTVECYAPNASARILDESGFIEQIVSNYAAISFNFGPTLLAWMERHRPEVYAAILRADRDSRHRFGGHGSGLAQAYNHSILPLCSPRDRITQIRWGIRDFELRFRRRPLGIWLPETAVDTLTLEVLADEGIEFTVLAPHQAKSTRPLGAGGWQDVSGGRIDPRRTYVARPGGNHSIALFFYDGPVSQAVAFERLLESGDRFADRLMGAFDASLEGDQLVHIATDGETYGHHHRHGDMALAYALQRIDADPTVALTNYGEHLARCPPQHEVEIAEKTSWSCVHGVERWRADCGCNAGGHPEWSQRWRAPLREALDWLASHLEGIFSARATALTPDPEAARDAYVDVVIEGTPDARTRFIESHLAGPVTDERRTELLKLLEMQRHALLMFTSCGWFFDEISGIEATQILRYAARAIQLAQGLSETEIEPEFLQRLALAPSNLANYGDGRSVYETSVLPVRVDLPDLVAHFAVSSLFTDHEERADVYAFRVDRLRGHSASLGRSRLRVAQVRVTSRATLESAELSFGFVHLGDHNMSGGVRGFRGEQAYQAMQDAVVGAFERADMPEVLRVLDKHFGELTYSMRALFRDEQRRVLDILVRGSLEDAEALATQLYEHNSALLRYLATLDLPLPIPLRGLADFVLNSALRKELARAELDDRRIRSLLEEAKAVGMELDKRGIGFALKHMLESASARFEAAPERIRRLRRLRAAVELARSLPFALDLAHLQNLFYSLLQSIYPRMLAHAATDDDGAHQWCSNFETLGAALGVRVSTPAARALQPGSASG